MTPGPVPPRGYWAKLQNRALPTLVAAGEHTPHYLTFLDGLLTANKVAREFEFTPLQQSSLSLSVSLPETPKEAVARPELDGPPRFGHCSL